jgi:perosamine synthetase
LKVIPYGRHSVDDRDIRAVVSVLKSERITQGPLGRRLEEAFAKACGATYAVVVSSGTAALHLAALASGWHQGDEVITSPMTFAATAYGALYTGANIRFSDIDDQTLGLNESALKSAVRKNTRGVISVDFAGLPAHTRRLLPQSVRKKILIEDACHSLGASFRAGKHWKKVGSCHNSDMTVFSLHPAKHITSGEGGVITTRSRSLYERLMRLRNHGIERLPNRWKNGGSVKDPWYYEVQELGFNYRMSDLNCALALSQLKKLNTFVNKRREIARAYDRAFESVDELRIPARFSDRISSYHLYVLRLNFRKLKRSRGLFMKALLKKGIGTQVHYIPLYKQPLFQKLTRSRPSDFPASNRYYEQALSIPIYPSMTQGQIRKVITAIKQEVKEGVKGL